MKLIKKWKSTIAAILAIAMLITSFSSMGTPVYAQTSEDKIVEQTQNEVDTILRVDEDTSTTTGDETHTLTIHYNRTEGDYDGWAVHAWWEGVDGKDYSFTYKDEYGYLLDLEVPHGVTVGYIIKNLNWDKNHPEDQSVTVNEDIEIWVKQGENGFYTEAPDGLSGDRVELPKEEQAEKVTLTLHYNRTNGDYDGWNVHGWGAGEGANFTEKDDYGIIAKIELDKDVEYGYIIRKSIEGEDWADKNNGSDQKITISENTEIWVTQGQNGYHTSKPDLSVDETPIDIIVHYQRDNNDYDGFHLWNWRDGVDSNWMEPSYVDNYGQVYKFSVNKFDELKTFGFITAKGNWESKDGGDKTLDVSKIQTIMNGERYAAHIYVKQGSDEIFYSNPNKEVEDYSTVTLHFGRPDKDYTGWNIWVWGTGSTATDQVDFEWSDDYGLVAKFPVKTGNNIGYIIRKGDWEEKNYEADQALLVLEDTEIWVDPGQNGFHSLAPNGLTGNLVELPETGYEDVVTDEEADMQVFVHYYRYEEDYRSWNMWAWAEGSEGYAYSFINEDDFGRYAKINLKDIEGVNNLGFIVRKGEWSEKDIDKDRFIDLSNAVFNPETGKLEMHVYLVQDDQNIYYNESDVDKTPPLKTATFISTTQLQAKASVPFENAEGVLVTDQDGNAVSVKEVSLSKDKKSFIVTLEDEIEIGETYYISKENYKGTLYVEYYGIFATEEFESKFTYTGNDLGATYSKNSTTFKVWAPTASQVNLKLYQDGHTDSLIETVAMTKGEKGVWQVTVEGNLHKTYYTYEVTVGKNTEEAVDPYARTTGVNGKRAMVVNLDLTNPTDWESTEVPAFSGNITDAILYELHLRDLSTHISSGIENVGKFLQFTEEGTVSEKGVATGIDHLVEMGITHLHLLPSFDHRSIDETKLDVPQFNWGYDPQNYNVPEGSFSTDPYNGEVRINEFKQMVQSLHNNGIRVVMDVVYNHTGATADSDFNKIVPGYYYRQDSNGGFANGSGCGNETASERSMMRKFMIDSVVYWAKEYNIKGFRFDLMALHDVETMNEIEKALHDIDPTIVIYGEGWTGGGSPLPDSEAAFKGNAVETPNIAYFNDDMRDAIKGNVGNDWEPGYINGDTSNKFYERLQFGIVGSASHDQVEGWDAWAANPSQSISYVSAHDNNTLYDKLLGVEEAKGDNGNTSMEYLKQLQKQANAIVMTGQGVPFLHAGVEMMRTKGGNHNSYNASDEVNQINWDWKYEHYDVVEYYKGLIELRKAHPAFRMMEATDVQANLSFDEETPNNVMSFTISNHANGDTVSDIAVFHNVSDNVETGYLPKEGKWSMVVNGEKAGTEVIEVIDGNTFEMQPHSSYVLMLDYEAEEEVKDTEAPVITLNGEKEIIVEAGNTYTELGAKSVDAIDGELEVVIKGTVDITKVGTYTIIYTSTDKSGNTATVERIVIVKDTTKPVITLNGEKEIMVEAGNTYTELGAKAVDAIDGELEVVIKGSVDGSKLGTYTISYTATDKLNNVSVETRIVHVIDTKAPVITLIGDKTVSLNVGDTYKEERATAIDAFEGNVNVEISGTVDTAKAGVYPITYIATDSTGNSATITRVVKVVKKQQVNEFIQVETLLPDVTVQINGDHISISNIGDTVQKVIFKLVNNSSRTVTNNLSEEVSDVLIIYIKVPEGATHFEYNGQKYEVGEKDQIEVNLKNVTEAVEIIFLDNEGQTVEEMNFILNKEDETVVTPPTDEEDDENNQVTPPTDEDGEDDENTVTPPTTDDETHEETLKPKPENPETGYAQLGVWIGLGSMLVLTGSLLVWFNRKKKYE